jgi:protein-S-isoprenylcysteine O-methyltransferase Ste14
MGLTLSPPSRWSFEALAQTRLYDVALRLPLALFYLFILIAKTPALVRIVRSLPEHGYPMLPLAQVLARLAFLMFITLIVGMTLFRRRPVAKTAGVGGRLVALGGCFLPMLLPLLPHAPATAEMLLVSAVVVMLGNVLSLWTLSWLGRSFSIMPEARRPVTSGPYARIRHPLYACEQLALLGAMLQFLSPYALLLYAAQLALQLGRMRYEERVLVATFPDYAAYQARTARLIPGVY